ncbi:hypothetical protein GCM10029992_13370 [Glycomyces albus]
MGTASAALVDLAEHLGRHTIRDLIPAWSGGASTSATLRLDEFQQAVLATATVCGFVETWMDRTAELAEALMNQANQFMADIVSDTIAVFWMFFEPFTFADAMVTLVFKITKAVLFLIDLAFQVARIYLAMAQVFQALQVTFERAMPLLMRMAEAPR